MNYAELVAKNESGILKDKVKTIELTNGEFVIRQGELPYYCYILLEGKVKVFHTTSIGQHFLFGIFDQSQLYGDLEIPNNDVFFNSVQCVSTCKFIKIDKDTFKRWLKSDFDFATKVNQDLCTKLMKSSYRMVDNNYFPLEYHVIKYIIESSNNFKTKAFSINKEDLANYIGTNIRSINRILKQLSSDKAISLNKTQVQILNPEILNSGIKKHF